MSALLELCQWADQGHLPAAGAVLEQAQSFMDASRFYRLEMSRMTNDEH